jgi:hypothetical protein
MELDDPDLPMKGLVPTPDELSNFMNVTVRQARPDLEFSILLPDGWFQQPTPPSRLDFSQEAEFAPLVVFSAAKDFVPPILWSAAMRPAPKQGSVAEWLERQCYLQQLALQRLEIHEFLFGVGADAVAIQASDIGPQKMRITMFEDGGRLFVLTGMAPLELWKPAVAELSLCTLTFELLQPKGQTAAVVPPMKKDGDDEDAAG